MAAGERSTTRSFNNMLKNVFLVSGMYGMGLGSAFVQMPAAQQLLINNGYESISTVPFGLILFLSSPCAVLVPTLATKHGDKNVFLAASTLGVLGSLLQMTAVLASTGTMELILILIGASIQSFTFAASNNLRFAVAYFAKDHADFMPKATSLVIFGGVFSSLLGPLLAKVTRDMIPGAAYAGNFLHISIMYFTFGVLAWFTDFALPQSKSTDGDSVFEDTLSMVLIRDDEGGMEDLVTERPLKDILKETDLPLLILFQCLSYNIMALYMSNVTTPILQSGYSGDQAYDTIFAHQLGMFAPGLFSGYIVNFFGTWATTFTGFIIVIVGGALFLVNDSIAMFTVGMALVGLGWNLSFVGPSSEVSKLYTESEKSKVVGFNDGTMLLSLGVFSLSGSSIYESVGGWQVFNYILMGVTSLSALLAAGRGFYFKCKSESHNSSSSQDPFFDEHMFDSL